MRNLIIGSIIVMVMVSLMGCAVVPTGYGQYGVVLNGPAYSAYGYRSYYGGYSYGYGYPGGLYYGGYGYGWGPRWVQGYQRWVCEGPPPNTRCYWTWEPAHYE